MKKILYLFSLVILLFSNDIKASHYAGYDMTLISLGNDLYKLRAVAYRDARPGNAIFPSSMQFNLYVNNSPWATAAPVPSITVSKISQVLITYDPKDCPPPGADLLLEKHVYESAAINLSSFNASVGYYVTYTTCCRNPGISNVLNSGGTGITFTMEFPRLNTTAPTRFNSSPEFKKMPLISYNVGKLYTQDWSAVDPNGDSLVYKMAQSRSDKTTKPFTLIDFATGYKLDSNIADGSPDFNINSQTGIITYKPNNIGRYLISIRVEEWKRKSGSTAAYKIGEITREFQIVNVYYPETPPVLTHINSISSLIRDTINVKDTTTYFNRFLSKEQTGDSIFMKLVPEQGVYNNIFNSALFDVKFGKVGDTISSGTAINGLIISGKDSLITNFTWKIDSTDIKMTPYKFKVISYDKTCPIPLADTLEVELFVLGISVNRPTVLHVNKSSSSTIQNGSIANPYKTIQAAINNSQNGDSVIVAPGRYKENVLITNKSIYLTSNYLFTNDTNTIVNTIIDGDSVSNALYLNNFNGTINGFTIERGFSQLGAGIRVSNSATPTIRYCIIQKNRGFGDITGHGINFDASNGLIDYCIIRNNWGIKWTVNLYGNSTLRNSKIINNTTIAEDNVVVHSSATLYNLLIANNINGGLAILVGANQAKIRNLTIVNNTSYGILARGINSGGTTLVGNISNSIIWGNTGSNILYAVPEPNIILNIDNSIVQNGSAGVNTNSVYILNYGNNNSSANPSFKSSTNFELNSNSPAIGMGNTSALLGGVTSTVPSTDIMGNTRPNPAGSNPDIGAYESSLGVPTRLDSIQVISTSDTNSVPNAIMLSLKSNSLVGLGIGSYQLKLNYNASKYKLDSISKIGTSSSNGTLIINNNITGIANISWASVTNISNNLPLIKAYFTAIDSGKATFNVTNAYFNTNLVTTIFSKSVFNKLTYGDIDVNALVQAYDAMLALRYSVGMDPLPTIDPLPWEPWRIKIANVDTGTSVTANDASLILKYTVGIITKFPKRGIASAPGYVTVNLENNELVVRSFEDMGGLNITFLDHLSDLGAPTYVHNTNALSAFNKQANAYKIGVAFSESPINGTVILRIPYTGLGNQTLNMELVENTAARNYQLNVVTSINDIKNSNIKIYPNPTNNIINIEGLTKNENNTIQIFDVQGKLVITKTINEKGTIDLSELNKGVYVIKIGEVAQRIVKI